MKTPAARPRVPLSPERPGAIRVTEHYACFEGEGRTLGARTWLLRLSGCDLRCWWCDSKQSSFFEDEARELDPDEVERAALASGAAWLSLTGGEPTWRGEGELRALAGLCRRLRRSGLKVKVESNGRRIPAELDGLVDLWSIAPKWDGRRKGSAARTPAMDHDPGVLAAFVEAHAPARLQLKFVITDAAGAPRRTDLDRAGALLCGLPASARRTPVFFIPEAYAPGDYLERCRRLETEVARLAQGPLDGFDLRVQPQWHRVLHGDARGR